jgi:predicted acyl esterase
VQQTLIVRCHGSRAHADREGAPVKLGEIASYAFEILATANLFKAGHRVCIEISNLLDLPTRGSGATNVEYIPYRTASSRTTLHKIYNDAPPSASAAAGDS